MRTSKEWWNGVKNDPDALIRWLRNQYHGEAIAAIRMRKFVEKFGHQAKFNERRTVEAIAHQEGQHAQWVGELLQDRGVRPTLIGKTERYWDETIGGIDSWDSGCAVAAHAEGMRLERIRAIVNDSESPHDVRVAFNRIVVQEEFHARAFKTFASDEALFMALCNHRAGAEALGLVV